MIDETDGVWPPDGYTGKWAYHWPNGQVKYRANYVSGKTNGEVICYWEDGSIAQRGISEAGECRGVWTDYRFGCKFKETDYADNKNFVVRFFWPDGRVMKTQVWANGQCVEDRNGP